MLLLWLWLSAVARVSRVSSVSAHLTEGRNGRTFTTRDSLVRMEYLEIDSVREEGRKQSYHIISMSSWKKEQELEAQKKRNQALKYLDKEGQRVDKNVYAILADRQSSSASNARDNTLQLLFKEKSKNTPNEQTSSSAGKSTESLAEAKKALIQQQEELRAKVENPLPPNWKETIDPTSGNPYYWNTETQETTWTRPECKADPKNDNLPEGWVEKVHPATNQKYYFHASTGKTSSEKPTAQTIIESSKTLATSARSLIASNPPKKDTYIPANKTVSEDPEKARRKRNFDLDMLDPSYAKVFASLFLLTTF